MFRAYDFTFAGISASMYGMFVADIGDNKHTENEFGNTANIVETRVANRIKPIHYGVRYYDKPLKFPIIFGCDHELDRYEIQETAKWLIGYQNYQWLTIDQPDMEHIRFRCLIQNLTPISVSWIPMAFTADVVCDCPYGYSYPFSKEIRVNTLTSDRFYNDSTINDFLKPEFQITVDNGCTEFSVSNLTTGSKAEFSGLPVEAFTFVMDNENGILYDTEHKYNMYEFFNLQFLKFKSGDNDLVLTGNGTVTIRGMYLYNVGA